MINKLILSLGLLMFFSGCTIWQSRTDVLKETERETITKTTEVRQHVTPEGQIVKLTTETYQEEISKEVATSEQSRAHSSPLVEGGLKKAASFLGIPPDVINMIMMTLVGTGVGAGTLKTYDKVRDSTPRKPKIEAQV